MGCGASSVRSVGGESVGKTEETQVDARDPPENKSDSRHADAIVIVAKEPSPTVTETTEDATKSVAEDKTEAGKGDGAAGDAIPLLTRNISLKDQPEFTDTPTRKRRSNIQQLVRTIGEYRIVRDLGMGAFGQIFLAVKGFGDESALKTITLSGNPEIRERQREDMAHEVKVMQTLKGEKGVVQISDHGEQGDTLFIAMEVLPQKTLEFFSRSKPGPRRSVAVVKNILKILVRLHGKGVVHRDLKPSNFILMGEEGDGESLKLIDFGSAICDLERTCVCRSRVTGTPSYMSPETARGDVSVSGEICDLWAVAVIFFEFLNGYLPFVHDDAALDDDENIHKLKEIIAGPAPPREMGDEVSSEVAGNVRAALDKDRTRRPPSAVAWLDLLEKLNV